MPDSSVLSAIPQRVAPIKDMMLHPGGEAQTIDLNTAFGGTGYTYTLQNSNGDVVTGASIDDNGILTVEPRRARPCRHPRRRDRCQRQHRL